MGMKDFKVVGNLGKGAFASVTKVGYILNKERKGWSKDTAFPRQGQGDGWNSTTTIRLIYTSIDGRISAEYTNSISISSVSKTMRIQQPHIA